jgi:membrane protease YdiL (CAAX protease family)
MAGPAGHGNTSQSIAEIPQFSLAKILFVWAAAAVPMAILGWVVTPAVAHDPANPGFDRLAALTIGLIWQFVLVMSLLRQEAGNLRWSTIRHRLWLSTPWTSQAKVPPRRLWWLLVPLVALTGLFDLEIRATLNRVWVDIFPFLAQPPGFDLGNFLNTPRAKAQLVGNWGAITLFVISALFNTVLGEELLFRGLLLPRMAGVFKKWDWVVNGLLFGLYHLHQPWGILASATAGTLFYALPSRYFHSSWFGVIAHSGQSIFLTVLLLGLVLGRG